MNHVRAPKTWSFCKVHAKQSWPWAAQYVLAADFSDSVAAEIILTKVTETVRKLQKDGLTSSKKDNDLQGERIALKKSIADICGRGYMNPDFQHDWYYTRDYPEELDHAAEDTRIGVCTYCDAIANGCNEYYYESCTIFE